MKAKDEVLKRMMAIDNKERSPRFVKMEIGSSM